MNIQEVLACDKIVIAHRGDSHNETENTMKAFRSAHSLGAHILETDIHITKDEKVLIWHDDSFGSFDGGDTVPFSCKSCSDIVTEGLSLMGEKVPLLTDLLEELPEACINIDLKDTIPVLASRYAEILEKTGSMDRVITGSFHHAMLRNFRTHCPDAFTSATPPEVKRLLISYLCGILRLYPSLEGTILQIPESFGSLRVVSKGFARVVRKKGGIMHVWTVNDRADMERLYSWGVQGIVTDNPALALSLVSNQAPLK